MACEKDSFIVREHPDWILKNEKGGFLKIGFNPLWSYWFYALDVYNEEVRAYLKKVFHTILQEWNFDLVKLDFLINQSSKASLKKMNLREATTKENLSLSTLMGMYSKQSVQDILKMVSCLDLAKSNIQTEITLRENLKMDKNQVMVN